MGIDYSKITEQANYLVDISKELKDNPSPDKSGGYLNLVFGGFTKQVSLLVGSGIPSMNKQIKYMNFSEEKAHRVYSHWLRGKWLEEETPGITSYQTRNPEKRMWGGAVLFEDAPGSSEIKPNIVSFSGLAELVDESISFIIGRELGFMRDKGLLDKIKKISNNPFIDEMILKFEKNK